MSECMECDPVSLDDLMDTPECGCDIWICRECENEVLACE